MLSRVPYRWRVLAAVAFGTYMSTMDFSIVNVALPTLAEDFDQPPDLVVWVTLVSSLVVTGLTLTAGRAGDLYGRRRLYRVGWLVWTLGMCGAGTAQSIEQLIAWRVVMAIGGAMVFANGNALVTEAFPPEERGRALGTVGSVVGAGLMSGPIIGGLILSAFDWRALFWLRAPVGLFALLLATVAVRESSGQTGERRLDTPGAATLFVALSSTLLAVNRGQAWGWTSPAIVGLFAAGVLAFALFVRIESRTTSPVVSLELLRIRNFAVSLGSMVLNFAGQSAVTFLMPFYLLSVRGFSTAQMGLVLATLPAMMLLFSSLSGYVADRFAPRWQPALGIAVVSFGLLSLATLEAGTPTLLVMVRLAVVGIGTAIFSAPNSSAIMNAVPRARLGTASASVATGRNIGHALGLAVASAVLVNVASRAAGVDDVRLENLSSVALLDGIRTAFVVAAGLSGLGMLASAFRGRRVTPAPTPAPEPVPAALGRD